MSKNVQKISFLLLSSVIVAFSVLLNSCKKDPVVQDPCINITCRNGGTCANGSCNCTTGYSGSDCSKQVAPTKIRITKIDVLKFPATTSTGGGWDPSDAPDIFPKFLKGTTILWNSPNVVTNALQGTTYTFTPSTSIEITAPKDEYIVELWDYDTLDPDDYMGGIKFVPYNDTNGFPATITLECASCNTSYKLYLQYTF
jgi:hypothetical protein